MRRTGLDAITVALVLAGWLLGIMSIGRLYTALLILALANLLFTSLRAGALAIPAKRRSS